MDLIVKCTVNIIVINNKTIKTAEILNSDLLIILSFINSDYTTYINSFFFSNFFTLTIVCIVIGLPFSLIYNRNKNVK